jgi:hypothetical protein
VQRLCILTEPKGQGFGSSQRLNVCAYGLRLGASSVSREADDFFSTFKMENNHMSTSTRPDGRTLVRKIQDDNWKPILAVKEQTSLDKAIEDKQRQLREERINRLPQQERIVARLKGLQADKEESEEFETRRTERIEENRTPIARVQAILERWEADDTTPAEWLVEAQKTLKQLSHPDACKNTAGVMVGEIYKLAQDQRDQQVAGIVAQREQLDAMLAQLTVDQKSIDEPEKPVTKVKLSSTTLSEQGEELFRAIAASPHHSTDETFEVHDAVRAARAGNPGPIAAMLARYAEPVESEVANDSDAS